MAELPTATVADFWSWGPCDPDRWRAVLAEYEDEPWTALDVLDYRVLPRSVCSDEDRLWAVLRPELIPEHVLHEFACVIAERALRREREAGREPDPRSWAALEVKRAWLRGEATDDNLAAAGDAARAAEAAAGDAAWAAAWAAARAAAGDAAWAAWAAAGDAAWTAARAAARAAARDAARAAARAAARDAERARQVQDLRRLLKKEVSRG